MDNRIEQRKQTPDAAARLWKSLELVSHDLTHDRLTMGRIGMELRNLYSERHSGGGRRSSCHGSFERELEKRGFNPRRVREFIRDYRVSIGELPLHESTQAKRKARGKATANVNEILGPLACRLNHAEMKAAVDAAAKRMSGTVLKSLLTAWERAEPYYLAKNARDAEDLKAEILRQLIVKAQETHRSLQAIA